MSLPQSFVNAVKAAFERPEFKQELNKLELAAIGGVETLIKIILEAAQTAIDLEVPAVLRPLADLVLSKGVAELEKLTDEEAKKLLPASASMTIGSHTFALTVTREFPKDLPSGPEETVADWPTGRGDL